MRRFVRLRHCLWSVQDDKRTTRHSTKDRQLSLDSVQWRGEGTALDQTSQVRGILLRSKRNIQHRRRHLPLSASQQQNGRQNRLVLWSWQHLEMSAEVVVRHLPQTWCVKHSRNNGDYNLHRQETLAGRRTVRSSVYKYTQFEGLNFFFFLNKNII